MLGVSVGTVQLWSESGLLQAWKTAGGHRRVIRESVERLLHKAPVPASKAVASEPPIVTKSNVDRRLQVLVVEDDVNLLRLYQAKLGAWPMAAQVTTTDNAFAALLMMGRVSPDLLITDLSMPGMDGFEVAKRKRDHPNSENTPVIFVTAMTSAPKATQPNPHSRLDVCPAF